MTGTGENGTRHGANGTPSRTPLTGRLPTSLSASDAPSSRFETLTGTSVDGEPTTYGDGSIPRPTPEADLPRHAMTGPSDPVVEAEQARAIGGRAAARMVERAPTRREVIRLAILVAAGVALLGVAVSILVALLAGQGVARVEAGTEANRVSIEQAERINRARYDEALRAAEGANALLASQGLAPVPIDRSSPAAAVVQASAARVLASLDAAQRGRPDEVGQAVATVVREGPRVDMGAVAGLVAGYLDANRDALRGPQGERGAQGATGAPGTPGGPPTQAEIEQAFRTAVASDPQLLCAGQGGEFVLVRGVQLTDERTVDAWICAAGFGEQPPTPPPATETVTADPDPDDGTPATTPPPSPPSSETAAPPVTTTGDAPLLDLGG